MSSEKRMQSTQSTGTQCVAENAEISNPISGVSPLRNGARRTPGEVSQEPSLRESLAQMIRRLTPNSSLREDLLQEAMIHLWRTETRRPGQTRSWYLQSCRFHLQHYLNCGRSIDSTKRWRDQLPHNDSSDDVPAAGEAADSGNTIFTCVSAREILSLLTPHLTPQEQAVLVCLAEGLGAREIGRKLNLSHTMAIRHRRKIAMLLKRLDLDSENSSPTHSNGSSKNGNGSRMGKKHVAQS
jgi:RNA polymerase sigma factor (sigma-70 family)